ncbi:MAG: alpha/beta fold hydrolase [Candidatus Limnocylindrales bacterium]
MPTARLVTTKDVVDPAGVVLVLHGGARRRGRRMVSPAQLSVLRMVPIARRIAFAGRGRIAVHRLLNSSRGWDTTHTPVMDVEWALTELEQRYGDAPVALVGHSLGGRAALLAGHGDRVVGVVALNPWLSGDEAPDLRGRRMLVVHGDQDRIASPRRSAVVVERVRSRAEVALVLVGGGRHAMVRHRRRFERYAAEMVALVLLDRQPRSAALRAALAGQPVVED